MNDIFPYFLYLLIIDTVDIRQVSPFAGISPGIIQGSWAFPFVCSLPTSIFEPAADFDTRIGRRLSGAGYRMTPVSIESLLRQEINWAQPFFVLISSNDTIRARLHPWIERQVYRPMHISTDAAYDCILPDQVDLPKLHEFSLRLLKTIELNEPSQLVNVEEWKQVLSEWKFEAPKTLSRTRKLHNCTEINNVCVESAGFRFEKAEGFSARKVSDYVDAVLESCEPIDNIRNSIRVGEGIRVLTPLPEVIAFAPGRESRPHYDRPLGRHSCPAGKWRPVLA